MGFLFSKPAHHHGDNEGWSYCTEKFEDSLEIGDLIEFDRLFYSHWALYYGQGQVVHFNPVESPETGAVNEMEKFVPGVVTKSPLRTVANIGRLRINNKLDEVKAKDGRQSKEILELIEVFLEKPGLYYSLGYFNCEHFVTYLKFVDGHCASRQVVDLEKNVFRTLKIFKHHKYKNESLHIFNTLAHLQWEENGRVLSNHRYSGKIKPRQIFQEGIKEWDFCMGVIRNPGWVRWILSFFGGRVTIKEAMKSYTGSTTPPILFGERFKKYYRK